MSEIQILKKAELLGHEFSVYGTAMEPYFKAQDVAAMLSLTNVSDMVKRVDDDEVAKLNLGGLNGEAWFLTENGLYEVLMQSRKPVAKQFKKGVKAILHDVRTTGGYIAAANDATDEEIMAKALVIAQNTIARRDERIKALEAQSEEQQKLLVAQGAAIEEKDKAIADLSEKNSYLDEILQNPSTVLTTQIAADYGMSAKKFNQKLADMKIQRKVGGQWILYAPYNTMGYVHSETFIPKDSDKVVMLTRWRQKGRLFLYEELKKLKILPLIERK